MALLQCIIVNTEFLASYVQIFGGCLLHIHLPRLTLTWQFWQMEYFKLLF